MLDFAGVPALGPFHGTSLRPQFEGMPVPDWRQGYYVQNTKHVSGIVQRAWRAEGWKLVASADGRHALYNLAADPEEELDLFRTPREDPGFGRFTHYPSHAPLIRRMCDAALAEADAMADEEGCSLFAAALDAAD